MSGAVQSRRQFVRAVGLSAVGVLAAACAPGGGAPPQTAAPASQARLDVVRISDAHLFASWPLYLGLEHGLYRAEGIDLQPAQIGTDAVVPALAGGSLEAGISGVGSQTINAELRGIAFKIVSPWAIFNAGDGPVQLMVRKALVDSGEVSSIADLKGKKLSLDQKGNVIEYLAHLALQKGGLTLADVDLQFLQFGDVPSAMANGAIDASITPEPAPARMEREGTAVRFLRQISPLDMNTVIYVTEPVIRDRADVGRRFLVGLARTIRAFQGNQLGVPDPDKLLSAENLAILMKDLNQPEAVFRSQVIPAFDPDLVIQRESIQARQQFYLEEGSISDGKGLPIEQLVDESFGDYVRQTIGRVRA